MRGGGSVLKFKAVYADEVKTKDVPVAVKEEIPEPAFNLKAPESWNGRDTIEVVPAISNLDALKAKGAGDLHYRWSVSGGAVIKEAAPDRLILKRSQYTGPISLNVAIDNGGAASVATASIRVTEPRSTVRSPRMEKGRPVTLDTYRSIGLSNQVQSNATARVATPIRTAAPAAAATGGIRRRRDSCADPFASRGSGR